MSDSLLQFPLRGDPAEFCLRNDIRPGDLISCPANTGSLRVTAIGHRRVLVIDERHREVFLESASAMDSGYKGWSHRKGPEHEKKTELLERHALLALHDCDVAFVTMNICDLTSQARGALKTAWASVQDALIRRNPSSGYAEAVKESPDSAYNLVRSERKIRDALPEQPVNDALLPEGPAATAGQRRL